MYYQIADTNVLIEGCERCKADPRRDTYFSPLMGARWQFSSGRFKTIRGGSIPHVFQDDGLSSSATARLSPVRSASAL